MIIVLSIKAYRRLYKSCPLSFVYMNVKTVDIVKPKAVNTHIKKKIIQILVVA